MRQAIDGPRRAGAYWRGFWTLVALGALTWVELRLGGGPILPLLLIGLGKAALILHTFMHIARLWKRE